MLKHACMFSRTAAALLLAACANSTVPDASSGDLRLRPPDHRLLADLRMPPPDLAESAPDLTMLPPDLAEPPPDVAMAPPDLTMPPPDLVPLPPDLVQLDLIPSPTAFLDLQSGWTFSADAQNVTDPTATVTGSTATSVTVTTQAIAGGCGCSAQHKVVSFGRQFPCNGSTLKFTYTTSGNFAATESSSLWIRFLKAGNQVGQFLGSEWTGHSNCATPWNNQFPATPQIKQGTNAISLGQLMTQTNGSCSGFFDAVDIHVQGYDCAASTTTTLSNLQIF